MGRFTLRLRLFRLRIHGRRALYSRRSSTNKKVINDTKTTNTFGKVKQNEINRFSDHVISRQTDGNKIFARHKREALNFDV